MTAPIPGGIGPQPPNTFLADDPKRPHLNAIRCLDAMFGHDHRRRLLYYRENFYRWTGTHYEMYAYNTLRSHVYQLFAGAVYVGQIGRGQNAQPAWVDFDINRTKLAEIVEAMQHEVLVDQGVDAPTWLDGNRPVQYENLDAREMIACDNYLVNASSRMCYPHSPRLFNTFAVGYEYNAYVPPPRHWLSFLQELWPDDVESIETLQEIFGYLLTRRTDLQKMFMLIGPPRSGKGTVVRVLTAMLGGGQNVTSVSMADLNQRFGLADLMDKTLAIMQDARFRARDDGIAVERILSITGEDPVGIDRKMKDSVTARMPVRFMLVSNEIPKLQDESGALKTRMLMLRLNRSVDEARRDSKLIDRLLPELPGILSWALDGLERLARRRSFVQPKSASEDLELLAHLSSPITAFVEECCHVGAGRRVPKRELFQAWQAWCHRTGTYPNNEVMFAKSIRSAVSNVNSSRGTDENGRRIQLFTGISISAEGNEILSEQGHSNSAWPAGGIG